jgi:hypothetical protein
MENGDWRTEIGEGSHAPTGAVLLAQALAGVEPLADECAACLEGLPAYVDAEMMGQSGAAVWRGMRRHLLLCTGCAEAYVDLLETVWLAGQGRLPPGSPGPTPDLSFLRESSDD